MIVMSSSLFSLFWGSNLSFVCGVYSGVVVVDDGDVVFVVLVVLGE